MCGIVGLNFKPKVDISVLLDNLHNRGPDNRSSYCVNNNIFGHTRLSIIDLDKEANQPMVFDDIVLVFNGEIYNYKNLINDENLFMKTSSDSEVIIRLYQKYGNGFLNKLNGAFAFCIYDIKKDLYFCARDRYGKKPLYFYFDSGNFVFSSLIQPIIKVLNKVPELNKIALSQYLQFFTPLEDNTFYKGIKKLTPSSYIVLYKGQLEIKKYYKIKTKKTIFDNNIAIKRIEEILFNAIEARLVGDVEVGSLLSGGVDSSLISAMYSKMAPHAINTFSIGYDCYNKYSELPYAKTVASHIKSQHHEVILNRQNFIDSFENILKSMEEPHGDPSSIALDYLCSYINKQGIKTVLSGEGSDELFLGYSNYKKFYNFYQFKDSLTSFQKEFMQNNLSSSLAKENKESEYIKRILNDEPIYNGFGEVFTYNQKKQLFKKAPTFKIDKPKTDPIDWMSYIDIKIWLGNVLLSKVDKIAMDNSVETRNPFLDYNLVNLAFKIDNNLKMGNDTKYLLKQIAKKYIPNQIVNRTKKGFNTPYNEWLHIEFKDKLLSTVLEANAHHNLFDEVYIKYLYTQSTNNKLKQHFYLLYNFSIWYLKNYT